MSDAEKRKSFEVYINEGEMYHIQEWVSKHQNIVTGGDLFGLWLDDHTAVVQFVLGPGKKCRRTTTSFFQDVEYLQQAGSYLSDKHGLCNIGQWHSNHRLSLSKPSHGDENTVWGNMPVLGLSRYIVFIANITHNKVTVNCFLFHYQGRKRSLTKGQFKCLDGNSPLRLNEMILQNTFVGLESFIQPEMFESEMKLLRNNDDNMETSTKDKEQNAEDETPTSPKDFNTELQHGQPQETATYEKGMEFLRENDDTMETSTGDTVKYAEELNTELQHEQPRETATFETRRLQDDNATENQNISNEEKIGTYTGIGDNHDVFNKEKFHTRPATNQPHDTSITVEQECTSEQAKDMENRKPGPSQKVLVKVYHIPHAQKAIRESKQGGPRENQATQDGKASEMARAENSSRVEVQNKRKKKKRTRKNQADHCETCLGITQVNFKQAEVRSNPGRPIHSSFNDT